MIFKNTENRYGSISKLLHWVIALLSILEVYLIYWKRFVLPEKSSLANFYINGLHKPIGITLFFLVLFAIFWKLSNVKPKFPIMTEWEKIAARAVHLLLYLTLIVMPLTGFLMSVAAGYPPNYFGYYQFPMLIEKNEPLAHFLFEVHKITSFIVLGLVFLHIFAALKHHFINRDMVLKRMLPFID